MEFQAILGKWGNNLAIRVPAEIVRVARLQDGARVEIEAAEGAVIIRPAEPRVTPDELFRDKSPAAWRVEYAGGYDWEPDIGREVVAE